MDKANALLAKSVEDKECIIFPTPVVMEIATIGKMRDYVAIIGSADKELVGRFSSVGIKGKNGSLYWTADFELK